MTSYDDYRDPSREIKKRNRLRAFYPIIGLFVIALAGAGAFLGMIPAYAYLEQQGLFRGMTIPAQTLQLAVGASIFLIIILVFSLLFAIIQPRDKTRKLVSEKALMKERQAKQDELKAKKRRQKAMRQKMKQRNR